MMQKAHTEYIPSPQGKIRTPKECVQKKPVSQYDGKRTLNQDREEFVKLFSPENILNAFKKAKRNKAYRTIIIKYQNNLQSNLSMLGKKVLSGEFEFGPYKEFTMKDKKWRLIISSPLKDRVVHWVLYDYLLPLFENSFIKDTYGNLPDRGTAAALKCTKNFIKQKQFTYAAQLDFSKYFYSIHHEILIKELKKKVKNYFILQMLIKLIQSYKTTDVFDSLFEASNPYHATKDKGMPIGSLISQLFANIYLNALDHFVKDYLGIKGYVRYVDDIVIFASTKEETNNIVAKITDFSKKYLKLSLNPKKIAVFPITQGIDFVGYRIYKRAVLPRKRCQKNINHYIKTNNTSSLISSFGYLLDTDSYLLQKVKETILNNNMYLTSPADGKHETAA